MRLKRLNRNQREGIATVEMALCLPILITLTLATIDVCTAMYLKESVAIAAYEGSRVGCVRGGTDADAKARIKQILDERGITYVDSQVCTITPKSFETAATLEHVRVLVTVPASGNVLSPVGYFSGKNISSFVWMRKEYKNL